MFQYQNIDISLMGVINITPDSFSDGNQFNSKETFSKRFKELSSVGYIDIGAESTAPFNSAISFEEEIDRYKVILNELKSYSSNNLSIDSYHPETILFLIKELGDNFIWNDVSGSVDQKVRDILNEHKNLKYVLCHNLAPERELTSSHMDYCQEGLELDELIKFFNEGLKNLPQKRIILDPCFGFSKKREQNHQLLKKMPEFINHFNDHQIVIGISRKSFLRSAKFEKGSNHALIEAEVKQSLILKEMIQKTHSITKNKAQLIFRMHDENIFQCLAWHFKSLT